MITLKPLPFATNALSPIINEETVLIHHGKHHAAYVANLNNILAEYPEFSQWSVKDVLSNLAEFPESKRQAIINNAGQVYNHDLYWETLQGGVQKFELSKELGEALDAFGSYENFQKLWTEAGLTQFGSGWVWLSVDSDGKLSIDKTSNADSPFLNSKKPIMTMDVWEHAYYLDFQNKRADYIKSYFDIVNWKQVSINYAEATK